VEHTGSLESEIFEDRLISTLLAVGLAFGPYLSQQPRNKKSIQTQSEASNGRRNIKTSSTTALTQRPQINKQQFQNKKKKNK